MTWCVYFIAYGNKDHSPVKVGYTSDIDTRISNLQTCCPYKLKLIMTIPCESKSMAAKLERFLHNRLKRGTMQGEWFRWDRCGQFVPKAIHDFFHENNEDYKQSDYLVKHRKVTKDQKIIKEQKQEIWELKQKIKLLEQSIEDMLDCEQLRYLDKYR
jgi:transposase